VSLQKHTKTNPKSVSVRKKKLNPAHETLKLHLDELNLEWQDEYKFHKTRKWRCDFFLPAFKTAIEIQGGLFVGGRHSRGAGYVKDMEKFRELAKAGHRLLMFTPQEVNKGFAKEFLKGYVEG
jgi:very-short-patch-repair endonuclease